MQALLTMNVKALGVFSMESLSIVLIYGVLAVPVPNSTQSVLTFLSVCFQRVTLLKTGSSQRHTISYYSRDRQGEIDFVICL